MVIGKTTNLITLPENCSSEDELPEVSIQLQPGEAPNYSMKLYRLFYANKQDVNLNLEGQVITLKQGQLLTLSPGETVQFEKGAVVQSLSFLHDFFCIQVLRNEVYCDGLVFNKLKGLPIITFPKEEQSILNARLEELHSILETQGSFFRDRAINTLKAVLLHAAQFKLQTIKEKAYQEQQQKQLSSLVLNFQNLVEETYTQKKDVNFYSDALGVSSITLNRKVKDELGKTVIQAVNERLAIAARVALRSGQKSIKEVAFDLGFTDPLYFSRFFKKQFGSPPTQYFQLPNEKET
ncbi:MAG: helix-turn-helix domain-containing protein [Hyphomicrobiales bacterium]